MKPYYEHAGIVIFHGDWRDAPAYKADLLLTDPPYGLNEAAGKNRSRSKITLANDYGFSSWDAQCPSPDDFVRLHKLGELRCIFGSNHFGNMPPASCWLVWDKLNSGDFADCELAWTNFSCAVRKFSYMWNGMLKEKPEKRFHPTQKPLALMKWCISLAGSVRDVVDPYMGSGTTLVAAKDMGLRAWGYEREERYCEIAAKRLAQEVLF